MYGMKIERCERCHGKIFVEADDKRFFCNPCLNQLLAPAMRGMCYVCGDPTTGQYCDRHKNRIEN